MRSTKLPAGTLNGQLELKEVQLVVRSEPPHLSIPSLMLLQNERKEKNAEIIDWDLSYGSGTYSLNAVMGDKQISAKGKIIDLCVLVTRTSDGEKRFVPVALVKGEILCVHPDYQQSAIVNPREIKDAEYPVDRQIVFSEVKTIDGESELLLFTGVGFFAVDADENGKINSFDTSAMFAPGMSWEFAQTVRFGYSDKAKALAVDLQAGKYKLGAFGVVTKIDDASGMQKDGR